MAELTEREIYACLKENLRLAAEGAWKLSRGERGPIYKNFMAQMKLVEGACRQAGHWREDSRWFPFGLKIAEAQKKCGDWLRSKEPGWRFKGLAEILDYAYKQAIDLETKKTGRIGMILPEPGKAETRTQGRPVQVILPPGFERKQGTVH